MWIRFFDNLNKTLDDFVKEKELRIVVGGDFNVTFDSGLDCCGGNPTEKESVKVIHDLRLDFGDGDYGIQKPSVLLGGKKIHLIRED